MVTVQDTWHLNPETTLELVISHTDPVNQTEHQL